MPDLCVNMLLEDGSRRDVLVEVKTLHRGAGVRQSYYNVPDDNRASAAVQRRAAQIRLEYPAKARNLDNKYFPGGLGRSRRACARFRLCSQSSLGPSRRRMMRRLRTWSAWLAWAHLCGVPTLASLRMRRLVRFSRSAC